MAANPAQYGATGKQVGDFYASWMDTAGIEARGTAPLKPYLGRIDGGAATSPDLQTLFATTGYAVAGRASASCPTSPIRRTTPRSRARAAWACRATIICSRARSTTASARPIAPISSRCWNWPASPTPAPRPMRSSRSKPRWPRSNGRPSRAATSPSSTIPRTLAGLEAKAPEFDWALMLKTAGLESSPKVLMTQNTALTAMGKLLAATPLADVEGLYGLPLRQRSRARSCPRRSTTRASTSIRRRCRACRSSAIAGSAASQLVNGALGEAVGKLYVAQLFPAGRRGADDRADRESARPPIRSGSPARPGWTTPTRKAALAKLAAFEPRIGHPVKYIDYSSLQGRSRRSARQCDARRTSSSISSSCRASPSRSIARLWEMTPQTVNAYYNPLANQITFPAAILQPPYLRSQCRSGGQLRRDRRDHRPRNGPRLRRSGQPVRPDRQVRELVDRRGQEGVHRRAPPRSPRSMTPMSRCPARTSTAS